MKNKPFTLGYWNSGQFCGVSFTTLHNAIKFILLGNKYSESEFMPEYIYDQNNQIIYITDIFGYNKLNDSFQWTLEEKLNIEIQQIIEMHIDPKTRCIINYDKVRATGKIFLSFREKDLSIQLVEVN